MSHHPNLSRRDFIKATTAFVGGLIGLTVGLPSIAYLLSPSLRKTEDDSVIDLGSLENYPIGIPTRFELMRTKVNGWERTVTNYGMFIVRKSDSHFLSSLSCGYPSHCGVGCLAELGWSL